MISFFLDDFQEIWLHFNMVGLIFNFFFNRNEWGSQCRSFIH